MRYSAILSFLPEKLIMTAELNALIITAASIGFFHTMFGPDHYLPFIMMSWARKWSVVKTTLITLLCGLGHIGSSVVLGMIGVAVGLAVNKLEIVESVRGNFAAWLLIAFGLVYFVWGLRRAYQKKSHAHSHAHTTGVAHEHLHNHQREHVHVHDDKTTQSITPWVLFVIFVFGPCEPLIPIDVSGREEQFNRPFGGNVRVWNSNDCHHVSGGSALRGRSKLHSVEPFTAFFSRHSGGHYMPLRPGHSIPRAVSNNSTRQNVGT